MRQTNLLKLNVYEGRNDILNFDMLLGLSVGSRIISFFNYEVFHKKLKWNSKKLLYQNKFTKMTKCTYCESTEHNIKNCPNDSDLYNSLVVKADKLPKFESMTHKVLKKLAALSGNKTSLPKVQLIIVLTKAWEKLNAEKKNLEEETSCPICFLDFTHKNVCVTKCGHKFCLECILTHHKRKNDCPLCRAELCKEIKKVRPKSAPRSSASTIETVPIIRQYSQPLNTERLWNNYTEWEDEYGGFETPGPSEVDPSGDSLPAIWISDDAVRRPDHYRVYDDDFETNRMLREMDCYDSFEDWYDSHWSVDIGSPYPFQDTDNRIINHEWHWELLLHWQSLHPERVPIEVNLPNFNLQEYIMNIRDGYFRDDDVSLVEDTQNVTVRNSGGTSIDDLIDLMETHTDLVELFENDPIMSPISHQNQTVNYIDL